MEELKQEIRKRGRILNGSVLKVDGFMNHLIDVELTEKMAKEFADHFRSAGITRVLTVESGGIPAAYATARALGVDMVFAKKTRPSTMQDPVHVSVFSYTRQKSYEICLEKGVVSRGDNVLFIDDFLANGEAVRGARSLIEACGGNLAGVGICIDKTWQNGHRYLMEEGIDLYSLAPVKCLENGIIQFEED